MAAAARPLSGPSFDEALAASARRALPGVERIEDLRRLTGGASQESWSFAATGPTRRVPLVLRRAPSGAERSVLAAGLEVEAEILGRVARAGVPVPGVAWVLAPEDGLGEGFVMHFVEGETIARRILRDDLFAAARKGMTAQCGAILAAIHRTPIDGLPLRRVTPAEQVEALAAIYRGLNQPRPVFNLAIRRLRARLPRAARPPALVHTDFRLGNLIVGADGVRAVLDWEIAHIGDPIADLGWLCVNSWRFGNVDKPAMGIGTREELLDAYRAAGGAEATIEDLLFWETVGSLYWGISCAGSADRFARGEDTGVERAMIARRVSETEADLLYLMREEWP